MKKMTLGFAFFIIVCLAFSVSCMSKEVSVTEMYYETEYRQESYTTLEQHEIKTPHSTTLMRISEENFGQAYLFLFNLDDSGNVRWAQVNHRGFSGIKTFNSESTGQNHRISVTGPKSCGNCEVGYFCYVGRAPEAIAAGFMPIEGSVEKKLTTPQLKASYRSWIESQGGVFRYIHATEIAGYLSEESNSGIVTPESSGSDVEFVFDKMFSRDGWALICITPFEKCRGNAGCILTISVSYVYDDVAVVTREVTKYQEVPVRVEKLRTVVQAKKVPFWEVIFGQ